MKVEDLVKSAGRKFAWGYAALAAIFLALMCHRLTGGEFVAVFGTLVGALMAANYGENREKARSPKEVKPDAAPPAP